MRAVDCSSKGCRALRYDGFALIFVGLALVVVAAARFVRTGRLLDDQKTHSAAGVLAELILSAVLALIVAGFSAFLVLI
jgi:putative membrane protein